MDVLVAMGGEFFDDQENLREPGENPPYHASEIYRADARDVLGKLTSEGLSYSMPELQKQVQKGFTTSLRL